MKNKLLAAALPFIMAQELAMTDLPFLGEVKKSPTRPNDARSVKARAERKRKRNHAKKFNK